MQSIQIPMVRGDTITSDVDYTDFLPVNMIAVPKDILGSKGYLISHDGLTELASNALGEDRGGFYDDRRGYHVRVIGNTLYRLESAAMVSVGLIAGVGQCSFSYSFNNTAILSNGNMYLYDGVTLTKVTDPDVQYPLDQDWIDGYFFYTDGEFIYHSEINDEKLVDPLQYATAEIMPDKSIGVKRTSDNYIAVFGRYSVEYLVNNANQQFAFSRVSQKTVNGGICGTHCKTMIGETFYILGGRKDESPSIHAITQSQLQSVSTRSVDKILATYSESELAQAVLESRTDKQDQFLIVRLPRHTLLLNISAAKVIGIQESWAVLSYGVNLAPWLGRNGVYDPLQSAWIYGSASGKVYKLSAITAAQGGQPTEFEVRTPMVEMPKLRVPKLEVKTISGFSPLVAVALSITQEGAFYGTEYWREYGSVGQYDKHFIFRRIGFIPEVVSFRLRAVSEHKINFCKMDVFYG